MKLAMNDIGSGNMERETIGVGVIRLSVRCLEKNWYSNYFSWGVFR